jgi:hypothetical protein
MEEKTTTMSSRFCASFLTLVLLGPLTVFAQVPRTTWDPARPPDTMWVGKEPEDPTGPDRYPTVWSLDILISNDGFGLGTMYRRSYTRDISGFISFSISESKDEREFEYIDPYYNISYTPGKLNRFLVLPLLVGIQYRLFREDIVGTFRPYLNAGAGPSMIYKTPYVEFVPQDGGFWETKQVEFFNSIGRGHPAYTVGAFVGMGANFGTERSNIYGVNFRYYFTYLFGAGLPSLYNTFSREVSATKNSFGGFVISLNIGMAF